MPNKDGTANVFDALKHIGVALAGALVIYLTGEYLPNFFLLIIPTAVCAAGGYFAGKGDAQIKTAVGWGIVGLLAGIGFWIAQAAQ